MSRLRSLDTALAVVVVGVSAVVVGAFVANSPTLDRFPDTLSYQALADHLPRSFVSSERLPGYPVVMALTSLPPGGRGAWLLIFQGLMIVAAAGLTYPIARIAVGRSWIAFVASLLVAGDLLIAGFARVGMSEAQAVLLVNAVAVAAVAYLQSQRIRYLWVCTALMIALLFTRPEWAPIGFLLIPYVVIVEARRRALNRRLWINAAGCAAALLVVIGAYSAANAAVNGYFGMSSILNVALMGKVMVYQMESEAPPPYNALAPQVIAIGPAQGPWPLTKVPPFDDRNHELEGKFARAVILHDPVGFARNVVVTLLSSSTNYDAVFIRIRSGGAFAGPLDSLLRANEQRYAAFVLVLPLAALWVVIGIAAPREDDRAQMMGLLSLIVLYGVLSTAALTFDEFGRVHIPINPLSTVIVAGTMLLNVAYAFTRRYWQSLILLGATAVELLAIIKLHDHSVTATLIALAGIAFVQLIAILAGFTSGLTRQGVDDSRRIWLGRNVDEGQRQTGLEP